MIRIYAPYAPIDLSEGSFHVISEQARILRQLGHSVELVHWMKTQTPESLWARASRVIRSTFSDVASPELYYYPLSLDPRGRLKAQAEIGIYHYSFAYHWLQRESKTSESQANDSGTVRKSEKKRYVYFHNLESELFRLRAEETSQSPLGRISQKIHQRNADLLLTHEIDLARFADELWFLSRTDLEQLKSKIPAEYHNRLRWVGPSVDPQVFERRGKAFHQKPASEVVLGILGRFDFGPNQASLKWIIEELAPQLKQGQFKGAIHVVGKNVPIELEQKAAQFGFFKFFGFLLEIEDFWASLSFLLIPQHGGSGVRIKLLDALASGIPVLANEEALAPLSPEVRNSPRVFCSNSAQAWAEKILNERPYETREKFLNLGFEPGLDGLKIYHFLETSPESHAEPR